MTANSAIAAAAIVAAMRVLVWPMNQIASPVTRPPAINTSPPRRRPSTSSTLIVAVITNSAAGANRPARISITARQQHTANTLTPKKYADSFSSVTDEKNSDGRNSSTDKPRYDGRTPKDARAIRNSRPAPQT
jgi:hypothetical protein